MTMSTSLPPERPPRRGTRNRAWRGAGRQRSSRQGGLPSREVHMPAGTYTNLALAEQLLDALDTLSGLHPGFRPAHAKGLMCSGTFTPSPEAAKLTCAPHAGKPSTPVTVRYSDSTGVPTIPDNDPQRSGPRVIAVRFRLADHAHTDIVAHSTNGFPVRTGEEFLEFLRAAAAFGAGKPEALGAFLATHPNAKRFVEAAKPIPTSFAREAFFAVTAFRFTNAEGVSRHGRFRIRPEAGTDSTPSRGSMASTRPATRSPRCARTSTCSAGGGGGRRN